MRSRMGEALPASRFLGNQFMRGHPQNAGGTKDKPYPYHQRRRCNPTLLKKLTYPHVLAGKIPGIPRLTHIAMGRRKLVWRDWLDQWMESNKQQ